MAGRDERARDRFRAGLILVAWGGAALLWGCGDPPAAVTSGPTPVVREFPAAGSRLDVDGDGTVTSYTDALLILRYVSGFRGKTLIEDTVGERCTRCTAAEIEGYLDSL